VPLNKAQLEATGAYVCSTLVNVLSIQALQAAFHASIDTLQIVSFCCSCSTTLQWPPEGIWHGHSEHADDLVNHENLQKVHDLMENCKAKGIIAA